MSEEPQVDAPASGGGDASAGRSAIVDKIEEPKQEADPAPKPEGDEPAAKDPESKQDGDDVKPEFTIPEEYKDKPWAKNIKSTEDLFKVHDDAVQLIGKKSVVPDLNNATEEQITSFYNELRPKDKADYAFTDDVPEAYQTVYRDMFHETGLHPKQAENLTKKFNEHLAAENAKQFDAGDFEGILKKNFGDDYNKTAANAKTLIAKNLGKETVAMLDSVPNKYLGMMYELAGNIEKAYGIKVSGAQGTDNASASMTAEVAKGEREQVQKDIAALKKRPHTQAELDKLNSRYRELGKIVHRG